MKYSEVRGTDGATDCRVDPATPGWCVVGRTLVPVLSSISLARFKNFTRVGATLRRGIEGFGGMWEFLLLTGIPVEV